jgi:hypothetical protein
MFRSRTEAAGQAVSRIPGVVAVHNYLCYELDDMIITGL